MGPQGWARALRKLVSAPRQWANFNVLDFCNTMELLQPLQELHAARPAHFTANKKIKAEIMFGNPAAGCQGVGICRVMSIGHQMPCKCQKATVWIDATKEGKLRFRFIKSSLEKTAIRKHFGWRLFQVYEAYHFTAPMAGRLGLKEAVVRPGIYTVWESQRYLIIDF